MFNIIFYRHPILLTLLLPIRFWSADDTSWWSGQSCSYQAGWVSVPFLPLCHIWSRCAVYIHWRPRFISLLQSLFDHELWYLKVIETGRKLWLWIQNTNELQFLLNNISLTCNYENIVFMWDFFPFVIYPCLKIPREGHKDYSNQISPKAE